MQKVTLAPPNICMRMLSGWQAFFVAVCTITTVEISEKNKETTEQNERERKQCSRKNEIKKKRYVVIMAIYPIFSAPVYLESLFTFGEWTIYARIT